MNRRLLIIPLVIVAGILAAVFLTRAYVYAAPQQPIDYSHNTHVEAGVQCLYCHPSAMSSDIAGIPSVQKCMGCHNLIATESSEVQKLAGYWERGEPVLWKRVNQQADFVYFSHQPHLGAGVNCETCHGDVGSMEITRQAVKMDMGWCLDCHLEQPEEKVARLVDCIACHK